MAKPQSTSSSSIIAVSRLLAMKYLIMSRCASHANAEPLPGCCLSGEPSAMNASTSSSVNVECLGISIVRSVIAAAACSPCVRQLGAAATASNFWNYGMLVMGSTWRDQSFFCLFREYRGLLQECYWPPYL